MLIAQKKVLDEIDSNNTELQLGLKKKSSKKRVKQKISNNVDPVNRSAHSHRNEGKLVIHVETVSHRPIVLLSIAILQFFLLKNSPIWNTPT